jgi:hypothetical protein
VKKVIIPVHGMCYELLGYSQDWKAILNPSSDYEWQEFFWDGVNDNINIDYDKISKLNIAEKIYVRLFDEFLDVPKYSLANHKKAAEDLLLKFIASQEADEIIILAHSLGSVLSYETLQRLDQSQLDKIKLCTFGCPLTSSFERWFLEVKVTEIKPKVWINLWGTKDIVGGRPLTIKGFDQKNNYKFNTTHDELEYLTAAKNIISQLL